jgi:tol-pal system-associated acyl-CoA thioesterase
MQDVFSIPIRVYIEDTDAGGIVFYANYLKYMERARTEFVRSLGIHLRESLKKNVSFVVHSLEVKYLSPAQLDDKLLVTVSLIKLAKSYMVFDQSVLGKNSTLHAQARVKVACVDLETNKPRAITPDLYTALSTIN